MVPWSLEWASSPKIGMSTAERQKPKATNHQNVTAFKPSWGGKMRLPAPKKSEKSAKATKNVCRFVDKLWFWFGKIDQNCILATKHFIDKLMYLVDFVHFIEKRNGQRNNWYKPALQLIHRHLKCVAKSYIKKLKTSIFGPQIERCHNAPAYEQEFISQKKPIECAVL